MTFQAGPFDYAGLEFMVIMPTKQWERLSETCFRGREIRQAGNFSAWGSFLSMVSDENFRRFFFRECILRKRKEETGCRITLMYRNPVGWASTMPHEKAIEQKLSLRESHPNKHASALIVSDTKICAPQTRLITLAVEVRDVLDKHVVLVHSVYPGPDIGMLRGDITKQQGVVFFHWDSPGSLEDSTFDYLPL